MDEVAIHQNFAAQRFEVLSRQTELIKTKISEIENQLETLPRFDSKRPELKQDLEVLKINLETKKNAELLAKNYNRITFIASAKPNDLYFAQSHILSAKDSIQANKIQLKMIDFTLGNGTSSDWIALFVGDSILKTRSESNTSDEIRFISNEIYTKNKNLSTSDIVLVFRRVISGFYGKTYGRITIELLAPCFDQYRAEKLKAQYDVAQEIQNSNSMAEILLNFGKTFDSLPKKHAIRDWLDKSKPPEIAPEAPDPNKNIKMGILLALSQTTDPETIAKLEEKLNDLTNV